MRKVLNHIYFMNMLYVGWIKALVFTPNPPIMFLRFYDHCPQGNCHHENGEWGKEPTPNPSQEGNNPCRPVTRINKMKHP